MSPNSFEFSIAVPSSSPTYDRSPLGKITYVASAHVKAPGAGILKKRAFDLVDRVDFCIVTSPPQGEGEGSPLQLDVQMDRWSDHFGLASLTMHSNVSSHPSLSSAGRLVSKLMRPLLS